jgi:hypothetical protein
MWTPQRFTGLTIVAAALLLCTSSAHGKLTPQQKCQAGKNRAAGKYAACRQSAAAKFAQTGDATKRDKSLATCMAKFTPTWAKLEANAAKVSASCLDGTSTAGDFQAVIDVSTNDVATGLGGGGLPACPSALASCQSDLATCQASVGLLETNQTTCYDTVTNVSESCTGTGQDGEFQKGLTRSYTDNGDGTITDNRTSLTWEKLSDDDSVHDKDNTYTWADALTTFIPQLNNRCKNNETVDCTTNGDADCTTPSDDKCGFAGHRDWRLANVNELHSLLDYGRSSPMVDPLFDTGCVPSCAVTSCSCIDTSGAMSPAVGYWSSTTYTDSTDSAWNVNFDIGVVGIDAKVDTIHVRAVRGGA